MPKISELSVADLRGARDQIQQHLLERCGIDTPFKFEMRCNEVRTWLYHGTHGKPDHVLICEGATYDTDWTEFMDTVWKRVNQIPRAEVREIRSVMEALGGAIEILDKSRQASPRGGAMTRTSPASVSSTSSSDTAATCRAWSPAIPGWSTSRPTLASASAPRSRR